MSSDSSNEILQSHFGDDFAISLMFFQAFQTGILFCFQQWLITYHVALGRELVSKMKSTPSFRTALAIVFELEFFFFLVVSYVYGC